MTMQLPTSYLDWRLLLKGLESQSMFGTEDVEQGISSNSNGHLGNFLDYESNYTILLQLTASSSNQY